jgi:RHS repeat-associated protein
MAEELPLILSDGTNSYIYGPEGLPVEQINNTTGTVEYLHHDQQGSTRLLTGSTGTVTGKCTYSAYGTPTCEGTTTTPLGYDAQYTSSDTGLIYLRNRVYDPATAQFLTVDPLVKLTGAPYNYAGDNPLNEDDPTGLLGWSEIGQAIGVGLVCVATDGAGCVAAGLADLDANVVSNDYEAVAESCRAGEEESSSLTDLAGFALGAGVGGLADGSLSEEAKKALESTSAGQAALKQLVGLGAGSSVLTTLAYAQGHESTGSSCSCGK